MTALALSTMCTGIQRGSSLQRGFVLEKSPMISRLTVSWTFVTSLRSLDLQDSRSSKSFIKSHFFILPRVSFSRVDGISDMLYHVNSSPADYGGALDDRKHSDSKQTSEHLLRTDLLEVRSIIVIYYPPWKRGGERQNSIEGLNI
jgi:hypothetical protein